MKALLIIVFISLVLFSVNCNQKDIPLTGKWKVEAAYAGGYILPKKDLRFYGWIVFIPQEQVDKLNIYITTIRDMYTTGSYRQTNDSLLLISRSDTLNFTYKIDRKKLSLETGNRRYILKFVSEPANKFTAKKSLINNILNPFRLSN